MNNQTNKQARAYLAEAQVFDTTCAAPQALEHIASKWVILIIYALSQGTKRYSQLQQQIKGVSPKMLIQNLRKLEACGLVHRVVHPVVPPQVDYSLTPLGQTLVDPLTVLCEWAINHVHELKPGQKNRERRSS
ncbi:helix-turn-helix domain-containing protein [Leptolyngbya sp. FACHB-261]|uniref:winged helix-turn-helix transcriptional regulator n=1 Tax=Leptolyngbya sp. FACHB-261 TaxID=2692806 RepID=UPI001685309A|nr:helix-turn-helix domain-containing protein [Leptolyngbya sp. FACHB-261]MBD2104107.1 helix-turn-helix transcriptional regulator [Leptolyngbya sp. FACHB-261]